MYINPSVYPSCAQSCPTLFAMLWTVVHTLLCPWNIPSKNTGVSCHFLFQGIFPTLGQNSHLLCLLQAGFLPLEPSGKPRIHLCICESEKWDISYQARERMNWFSLSWGQFGTRYQESPNIHALWPSNCTSNNSSWENNHDMVETKLKNIHCNIIVV